jgi:hypothetical protein
VIAAWSEAPRPSSRPVAVPVPGAPVRDRPTAFFFGSRPPVGARTVDARDVPAPMPAEGASSAPIDLRSPASAPAVPAAPARNPSPVAAAHVSSHLETASTPNIICDLCYDAIGTHQHAFIVQCSQCMEVHFCCK